jgi:gliding motility-associated peptidyl-prolyl isomerase
MKNIKLILVFTASILLVYCSKQQARRPISQTSNTFMKESVARNKVLIKGEEGKIDSVIKNNPQNQYIASKKGYWYFYETKSTTNDTLKPRKGDIAYFDYEIKDLIGNVIYSDIELKPQVYKVDKENIITGLQDGIKLMKKKEKITFLFPSHIAYGFRGDTRRIKSSMPIVCTVTLNDFKSEKLVPPTPAITPKTVTKTE